MAGMKAFTEGAFSENPIQAVEDENLWSTESRPIYRSPSMEKRVASIEERLLREANSKDENLSSNEGLSIYRVPRFLREANRKAYSPRLISIGPYHRGKEELRDMEQHKWRTLRQVLKRSKVDVSVYLGSIRMLERNARRCYQWPIDLSSIDFVETMLLDGCFILELLQISYLRSKGKGLESLGYSRYDPIFGMLPAMYAIQTDLIKLENQIPFFILDRLLSLQNHSSTTSSLIDLANRHFGWTIDAQEPIGNIKHLLDLYHRYLFPSRAFNGRYLYPTKGRTVEPSNGEERIKLDLPLSVTKLAELGIQIKKGENLLFWDIRFVNGALHIPTSPFLQDNTETEFLNLMAFEMCHLDCPSTVTSYLAFMSDLIDNSRDVAYLEERGIIEHVLGSKDEVAGLFNRLCREVVEDIDDNYLSGVSKNVSYCVKRKRNSRWHRTKRKYFNYPWSFMALIAVSTLLGLAFVQALFTII